MKKIKTIRKLLDLTLSNEEAKQLKGGSCIYSQCGVTTFYSDIDTENYPWCQGNGAGTPDPPPTPPATGSQCNCGCADCSWNEGGGGFAVGMIYGRGEGRECGMFGL